MVPLEFFIDIASGRNIALGSTKSLTELSTSDISSGMREADNLTIFMSRLSGNLGSSTSCTGIALPFLTQKSK
jgi:hypothetical protein